MVQFNLLPDVKLEYIKAVRKRRFISAICIIVAGAFLIVFVLMFLFVRVNQTHHMSDLKNDITANVKKLQDNKDLDKILTIQSQLKSLPGLHEQKVMSSRMFDYLAQITPSNSSVTSVEVDFEAKIISIKGLADSLATVNKFVDTVKFTEYTKDGNNDDKKKAFNSVVLTNFAIAGAGSTVSQQNNKNANVTFEITTNYEGDIFVNTAKEGEPVANSVILNVPKTISNLSEQQKPSNVNFSNGAQQEGGSQ